MTDREKDELAAQVLAVMRARFDPPSAAANPPAAIEHATPTSPWHPTSAPLIEAFSL